ncbi:hypothetical protein JWJ90_00050 [Desulfobulbus rhabdoformis]|uniref:hypothetical protein n=1 Tax=Desulfobulbus rhabdoformis TaxID=34032 RepID=UPI00196302F4|nr:hypothetical protein [Desulfobulbus rhabdoformis]MBM9612670.1 hypothetical protein [Desulfobulbus rhabdoformis]
MFQSSVTPEGMFRVGKHSPSYQVKNLRENDCLCFLGTTHLGQELINMRNFPKGDVQVDKARAIYEIRNPLPFRGCTFIDSGWADNRVGKLEAFAIKKAPQVSLRRLLGEHCEKEEVQTIIGQLPMPLRYELAATSTDAQELVLLAQSCCRLIFDEAGEPQGLCYLQEGERIRADIDDFELFETIANNPYLPNIYKEVMVLRPGVQGSSEIVGEYTQDATQIFEYLRTNSYIPWGHYAANFAHTAIRYAIDDLSETDMHGLRHLYYQRMFVVLASKLGLVVPEQRKTLSVAALETLRIAIQQNLEQLGDKTEQLATLWGWNFGYDFSGSGYRLHASHQMIHQQYAMVPQWVEATQGDSHAAYCCGDLVADVVEQYQAAHQSDFFNDYLKAIRSNTRTDQQPGEDSLIVWQDAQVLLFVPKAQVSQWELQLMVIADESDGPVGNVFEANSAVRHSLDCGILKAQQVLAGLGAEMVTSIEYSKRIGVQNGQRLLYSFLPKLPWSMGAFSEAQGRYILGHYPEDFASACRAQLIG